MAGDRGASSSKGGGGGGGRGASTQQNRQDGSGSASPRRPAGQAARELQAKLAASRAASGGPSGHQRLKGLLKEGRGGVSSGGGGGIQRAGIPQRGSAATAAETPALASAAAPQQAAAGAQQQRQQPQQQRPSMQQRGGGGGGTSASGAPRGTMAGKRGAVAMAGGGGRGGGSRGGGSRGGDGHRDGAGRDDYAAASSHQQQQRRPTAQRSIKRRDAGTIERFEREVLGGRLWHPPCQGCNVDLPDALPTSFDSEEQYVSCFESLLFEEAREAVRDEWSVNAGMGRAYESDVLEVGELGGGWHNIRLQTRRSLDELPREGNLVVLTLGRPPQGNPMDFINRFSSNGRGPKRQRLDSGGAAAVLPAAPAGGRPADGAGGAAPDGGAPIAAGIVRGIKRSGEVAVSVFPVCTTHQHDASAPCRSVVGALRQVAKGWLMVPVGMLTTQQREYVALHKAQGTELLEALLAPERLALAAEAAADEAYVQRAWPPEAAQRPFIEYLRSMYDATQLRAIEFAAAHLGSAAPEGMPPVPFVMIQGPPGTGKTHTVKGVLNVWHLVAYQRFYESLVARLTPEPEELSARPAGARNLMAEIQAQMASAFERRLSDLAQKPRILVCAPSNAAADELLTRVMNDGFADGNGHLYRPSVVRIGSDQAPMAERARDVWVDGMIAQLTGMPPQLWQHRLQSAQADAARLSREISTMQAAMRAGDVEAAQIARNMAHKHEARDKALLLMERLQTVEPIVTRQPGASLRNVQDSLEASFVSEAEMVFTTLSSTGRKVFERLGRARFETVLIDEAAQATELANLQAFAFGCKQVVLVGDPRQLPATVKSLVAQKLSLARSLFERLQGGCPAAAQMLSIQYRMHPFIRQFPSRYFYEDALQDAPDVLNTPPEPFYEAPLLKPYVFFDVAGGREARGGAGSKSKTNKEEAELAAALFAELRGVLLQAMAEGRLKRGCAVGVITFYKAQVPVLRAAFKRAVGEAAAREVMIETVDSFQGKQLDVIMLSCVRASRDTGGPRNVGFVSDIRRLNVAITRAKRALWICGNAATLRSSEVWDALVEDAVQRGVLIQDASARSLFPDQEPFVEPQPQPQGHPMQPGQHQPPGQQPKQPAGMPPPPQQQQPPPVLPPPALPPPRVMAPPQQQPQPQQAPAAAAADPRRQQQQQSAAAPLPQQAPSAAAADPRWQQQQQQLQQQQQSAAMAAPADPRRKAQQQPSAPSDPRQRPPASAVGSAAAAPAAVNLSAAQPAHGVAAAGPAALPGDGAGSAAAAAAATTAEMPRSYSPPAGVPLAPPQPAGHDDAQPQRAVGNDFAQPQQPAGHSFARPQHVAGRSAGGQPLVLLPRPQLDAAELQAQAQQRLAGLAATQRRAEERSSPSLGTDHMLAATAGGAAAAQAATSAPSSPESGELQATGSPPGSPPDPLLDPPLESPPDTSSYWEPRSCSQGEVRDWKELQAELRVLGAARRAAKAAEAAEAAVWKPPPGPRRLLRQPGQRQQQPAAQSSQQQQRQQQQQQQQNWDGSGGEASASAAGQAGGGAARPATGQINAAPDPGLLPVQPPSQQQGKQKKQHKKGRRKQKRNCNRRDRGKDGEPLPLRFDEPGEGPTFFDEMGSRPASANAANSDMMANYAAALNWDDDDGQG